jgi:hypothetical protein
MKLLLRVASGLLGGLGLQVVRTRAVVEWVDGPPRRRGEVPPWMRRRIAGPVRHRIVWAA